MKLWPKSKKFKELEAALANRECTIERLVDRLYKVTEDHTSDITLLNRHLDKKQQELEAAKALAVTRHKKIKELEGIINQLKERGNDGKPTGRD